MNTVQKKQKIYLITNSFRNINVLQGRIPWAIFTKFPEFVGDFMLA